MITKLEEKKKKIKELKAKFKEFEEYTGKNGYDYVRFNLGEMNVPQEVKEEYLKIIPKEGKSYLLYTVKLGMNEKIKLKNRQERAKKSEEINKIRERLKLDISDINSRLKEAVKLRDNETVTELIDQISQLEEELNSLKLRN